MDINVIRKDLEELEAAQERLENEKMQLSSTFLTRNMVQIFLMTDILNALKIYLVKMKGHLDI